MRYYLLIIGLLLCSLQDGIAQSSLELPEYLNRSIDINPPRKTQSYSWVISDLFMPNGTATLTGRYEFWDTRHQTRSAILGLTVGPISNAWTLPSAIKDNHIHMRLGGEWRRYADFYPNFYGVKLMLLPQFYSRSNDVLKAKDFHFGYSYARVRDLTTTVSGVAGIRPKFSNRVFTDITFELGLSYRIIKHVKYQDIVITEPPSLESALPGFVNNMLYDSNSKNNGGNLSISFKVGIAIGYLKFQTPKNK